MTLNQQRSARLEELIEYFVRERDAGIDTYEILKALINNYINLSTRNDD